MFRLNKKTEYAILALQHMMLRGEHRIATVKEISTEKKIPQSLLAKICQQLAKSKIIHSVQGPRGGYVLSKDASHISIAEVIEALEGPIHIVDCFMDHGSCHRNDECTLKHDLNPIEQQLSSVLKNITLAGMMPEQKGEAV